MHMYFKYLKIGERVDAEIKCFVRESENIETFFRRLHIILY